MGKAWMPPADCLASMSGWRPSLAVGLGQHWSALLLPKGLRPAWGPDDLLLMRRAGGNRPGLGQQIRSAQDVPGY